MANIYLLRHGKVDGDAALYGHTDVNVADNVNHHIVQQLMPQALNISHVFTSPLQRCAKLAEQLAGHYAVPVVAMDDLKEMHFGQYDGIAFDEVYQNNQQWQTLERFWQNPVQHPLPNAELLTGFSYRVLRAWQAISEQVCALDSTTLTDDQQTNHEANQQISQSANVRNEDNNILVVCHGGVIRMILAHLLQVDFRNPNWYTQLSIANGSLTSIRVENGKLQVRGIANSLANLSSTSLSKQEFAGDSQTSASTQSKSAQNKSAQTKNDRNNTFEQETYRAIAKEVLL